MLALFHTEITPSRVSFLKCPRAWQLYLIDRRRALGLNVLISVITDKIIVICTYRRNYLITLHHPKICRECAGLVHIY
jgi:hypothetical protein